MSSKALEKLRRWYREHPTPAGASVEELRAGVPNTPAIAHTSITPVMVRGPGASALGPDRTPAEWVLARGANPDHRILYLHGGGYCVAGPSTFRNFTSRLSAASGMAVLSLDYRLAPEHPFPAAVRDSVPAFAWMTANGPGGPGNAAGAFVAGDSSGGGLAIATLVKIRDLGDRQANAAIAISPWADMTLSGESWQTRKDVDVWITRELIERMIDWILPNGGRNQPLISPVLANLEDLPPLYLFAGDHEVLRDDTTRLAELARMMGVEVRAEIVPEMLHIFPIFPQLPEAREALEKMGRFLRAQVPASWPEQDAPAVEGSG